MNTRHMLSLTLINLINHSFITGQSNPPEMNEMRTGLLVIETEAKTNQPNRIQAAFNTRGIVSDISQKVIISCSS